MQSYDPYELMIIPPNKKGEMIIDEIRKEDKANLNLVSDLILLGANLNWQDNYGRTALYVSAYWNLPEITKMLIDAGADVNIQHNNGTTALHVYALKNRPEIAKMLIDAGADMNMRNNDGKLPYELARTQELQELLKL